MQHDLTVTRAHCGFYLKAELCWPGGLCVAFKAMKKKVFPSFLWKDEPDFLNGFTVWEYFMYSLFRNNLLREESPRNPEPG